MQSKRWGTSLVVLLCAVAVAQIKQENKTLMVNGRSGEIAVMEINGRTYLEVETLARIANGSFGFQGNQITLTLPAVAASAPAQVPAPEHAEHSGLSRDFIVSGIETVAKMREWGSTLAYAIQHGYEVTDNWVADYREQAAQSLNLATAAVSTDSDRNALQLLTNEFEAVRQWSNKLVEAKQSMDTAKYIMSPNTLRKEPLSQQIITCGHFLSAMLGSGEFRDDASCH
ncbi:MAG TPA: hypothetical protein VEK33_23605 [Terriglobales bacterium]|nr:hypothetical protein [Terriglobales bacterium]